MDDGGRAGAVDEVRIAGYRDFTRLSEGGFSTVYRATQERFDRVVVIKVLALELRDSRSQQRFLGEASVIGPLSDHPNIVHVLDSGFTEQGRPYIASEHMARGSLADRLAVEGPLPTELVLRVGVKICGAVAAMHALDVMHRDIKPENILMSHFDEPGLADFGIATVLAGRTSTSGTVSSTPVHAPPEVLDGQGSRPATDIWSLGSTLYTLLAGRTPFEGERGEGLYPIMQRIVSDPVPPIGRPDVPAELEAILAIAMAKDPAERYGSALTFGRVLQDLQEELGLPVTEMIAPRHLAGDGSTTVGTQRGRDTIVLEVSGVAELAAARASGEFDRLLPRPRPPTPAAGGVPIAPAVHAPGASHFEALAPRAPAPAGAPPAPAPPIAAPPIPASPTPTSPTSPTTSAPAAPVPIGPPITGSRTTVPPRPPADHLPPTPPGTPTPPVTPTPPAPSGSAPAELTMATPPLVPVAVGPPAPPVPPPLPPRAGGPAGASGSVGPSGPAGTPRPPGPTLGPFTSSAHRARRRSIILAAVAGVVAVAVIVAAIIVLARRDESGGTAPGSSAVPGRDAPRGSAAGTGCGTRPAAPAVPASADEPRAGGVLRFGLRDDGDGWDPRRSGFTSSSLLPASAIYEPVAAYDENGSIQPWLAESITPNADFTEYAIRVRPNVRFHDGQLLDADALRANFEESKANSLIGLAYLLVSGFSVRDASTVVVSLKQPWPTFPNVLTGQFSYVGSPKLIGTEVGNKRPIGTGPFVFKDWTPGQHLTLVRNDAYWGGPAGAGPAHLDGLEFRVIADDDARRAALASGEIDGLTAADPAVIEGLGAARRGDSTGAVEHVLLNTSRPPFDDIAARRLLAAATDRQALVAEQHGGLVRPASSPFPSTSRWCVDDTGAAPFDEAYARRLADEYARVHGHPLTFPLSVPRMGDMPEVAARLAAMWAAVGIKADVAAGDRLNVTWSYVSGEYTAGLHAPRPVDDPDSLYDQYHTGPAGQGAKGAQLNLTRVSDPRIDEALQRGRTATDPQVRRDAYGALARDLNDVVPVIYLFDVPQAIAVSAHVHGADDLVANDRSMTRPWVAGVWLG